MTRIKRFHAPAPAARALAALTALTVGLLAPAATAGWGTYHRTDEPPFWQPGQAPTPGNPNWTPSSSPGTVAAGGVVYVGIDNYQFLQNKKELTVTITGANASMLNVLGSWVVYQKPFQPNVARAGGCPRYATGQFNKLVFTIDFPVQGHWEFIKLENTSSLPVTLGSITATSECERRERAGNSFSGDGVFGGAEGYLGAQMITEIYEFPEIVPIDTFAPATMIAPPQSGNWFGEYVFEDPEGEPRPLGGVRWFTDGPGLAPGEVFNASFSMLGPADLDYTMFAFDASTGEHQRYHRDASPQVREWVSSRQSTSGSLGMAMSADATGDPTDATLLSGVRPAVEPRLGGVRRLEIEFDQPIVLADPGAISVSDGESLYPPDLVVVEGAGDLLVIEFTAPLPNATAFLVDIGAAIADFRTDGDALIVNLEGDANGDGRVSDADVVLINEHLGEPADPGNATLDLDLDGVITPADADAAETRMGDSVLCPGSFPSVPWYEDFDDYEPGSGLHGSCGWKGWDDDPAFDAPVSGAQARSGAQALDVSGDADLVAIHPDVEIGAWSYTAWQYIPSDFVSGGEGDLAGSYFILLNTYEPGVHAPSDWSLQIGFDSQLASMRVFHGDGLNTIDVPYETDRWVKIQTIIDLEEDWTRIYYDDDLVTEYSWTGGVLGGGGGALDVAVVDLYAQGSSSLYYDDLRLEPIAGCGAGLEDDADGDGLSRLEEFLGGTDSCDPDSDLDGVLDGADNCPHTWNPDQDDTDGDGTGDVCDEPDDVPPCPADVNGDQVVDVDDLVEVVLAWGVCDGPCAADVTGDGEVDVDDLVQVVLGWGGCG